MTILYLYAIIGLLIAILVFGACKTEYDISNWNTAWLTFAFLIGWPIVLISLDVVMLMRVFKRKSKIQEVEISNIDNLTEDSSDSSAKI